MGAWAKCDACGCVVADTNLHEQWHREQGSDGERAEAQDAV